MTYLFGKFGFLLTIAGVIEEDVMNLLASGRAAPGLGISSMFQENASRLTSLAVSQVIEEDAREYPLPWAIVDLCRL